MHFPNMPTQLPQLLLVLSLLVVESAAFAITSGAKSQGLLTTTGLAANNNDNNNNEGPSRRSFLTVSTPAAILSLASLALTPETASAEDALFKKNPLTNGFLEQVRILQQAEADDIKYNGELAPGDAANRGRVDEYPKLLVPILKMSEELKTVDTLVHSGSITSRDDWAKALKILQQSQYDKSAFKKIFNSFADNIYYGDPDRANLYLGGGTTPKSEQSLAYLLRNDILTNLEALQAELEYLIKETDDTADLFEYSSFANVAMKKYLGNVSPAEMDKARELLLAAAGP